MPRTWKYSVVDVFAERALEGNALAVFHDGRGLTDGDMQALARETNLSETTFVLPGENDAAEGVRVRIFTTAEELPFAGHPALGTASWLRLGYGPTRGKDEIVLQLNAGPIHVTFSEGDGMGAFGTMRQKDPEFGPEFEPAEIAEVIGVPLEDFLPGYRPQLVSTGNAFCIVALKSVEALRRLAIPQTRAHAWLRERGGRWFYCVAPADSGAAQPTWRARMQFNGGEDPATGSAAGPCIAWLVKQGLVGSGVETVFEQGVEINRPSRLLARALSDRNSVHTIDVSGRTIPVAEGSYLLGGR
jgi:trans-2,3-dihydro-3-hydroxyanthranilate isomerase